MRKLLILLILPLSACFGEVGQETTRNGIPFLEYKTNDFQETGEPARFSKALEHVYGIGSATGGTVTMNIGGIPAKVRRVRYDTYDFLLITDQSPGGLILAKPNHGANFKQGAGAATGCAVLDVYRRSQGHSPTSEYLVRLQCPF